MFCTRTHKFMYLTDQNDMESFVPDENFQFSAALGWAVASVAFWTLSYLSTGFRLGLYAQSGEGKGVAKMAQGLYAQSGRFCLF